MIDRACISLNDRCNLSCKYCHFSGKANSNNPELMPQDVTKIIENIGEYCVANGIRKFKLGIVGSGEPMLSVESLKAIVITATRYASLFALYTITNGVCITGEQLLFFKQYQEIIELNFSLDGYEELHNTFRQKHHESIKTIKRYTNIFGNTPRINATVTRQSIENKEWLVDYFIKNGFTRVNFSIVVDARDPEIIISKPEYEQFLDFCVQRGLKMRQKRSESETVYDCAMYGRNCGVGHTNIFITQSGIYPCGRFYGLQPYRLGDFSESLDNIEGQFRRFKPIESGQCYYDTYVGERK